MLPKRFLSPALVRVFLITTVGLGLVYSGPVAAQDSAQKIASAMSAAPTSIAEHATILDNEVDANGKFVVLREGDNGWYCSPDAAGTPGPDPWCYDQPWLDWSYAFLAGEDPHTTTQGFSYMLQGGSDASNTDPFATEPAAGEDWMNTPPHIMLLMPEGSDLSVFSTDHLAGGPWLMWAGTPYEHVMVPLAAGNHKG